MDSEYSPYNIRATERHAIPTLENLAEKILRDLNDGTCSNWSQVWEHYHTSIATLSLRSEGYPTGKVLADIIDLIEGAK
jgi:hypothetical protein